VKKKEKKKKDEEERKERRNETRESANRARVLAIDFTAISDFRRLSARFIRIIAFALDSRRARQSFAFDTFIRSRAQSARLTIAIALCVAIVIPTSGIQRYVIASKSRRYRTTTPCSRITWAILDNERPNTNWTSTTLSSTSDATNWLLCFSAASSCRSAGPAAASYVPAAVSASVSCNNLFSLESPHSA